MSRAGDKANASAMAAASGTGDARPQRYGRYVLVDRLGAGGMAEVFRALLVGPEQFQRMVVVKRILPHLSENPGFIKMFIDEATLSGRLSHPNIIQVHEFGRQDEQYFIAMEYVRGRSLHQIMGRLAERQQHMPVTVAAEIIRQTCRGLAYAHDLVDPDNGKPLGLIHRDVAPGNVVVAYTGAVKVLDFGIARVANEFRVGQTDPGQMKGKSAYIAPEQVAGAPFDRRADIFCAGILLHEMLSGRRLFRGENAVKTLKLVEELPIPRPSEVRPEVPPVLEAIAMRALERDPAKRFATATELADALEAFLLEQRVSSQELPRFMQELFKEESASGEVRLNERALSAVVDAGDAAGAGATPLAESSGPRTSTTHDLPGAPLPAEWPDIAPGRAAELQEGRGKRLVIVTIVVVLAAGAIAAALIAGR
jgi:serine/threonine protein kinase